MCKPNLAQQKWSRLIVWNAYKDCCRKYLFSNVYFCPLCSKYFPLRKLHCSNQSTVLLKLHTICRHANLHSDNVCFNGKLQNIMSWSIFRPNAIHLSDLPSYESWFLSLRCNKCILKHPVFNLCYSLTSNLLTLLFLTHANFSRVERGKWQHHSREILRMEWWERFLSVVLMK